MVSDNLYSIVPILDCCDVGFCWRFHDKGFRTMSPLLWIQNFFSNSQKRGQGDLILPLQEQIIPDTLPKLTEEDRREGFIGTALFYGFGDDGKGHAEPVLSGRSAWEYAYKSKKGKTWQCEYVDFNKPEDIRHRPGASVRPKGFFLGYPPCNFVREHSS
jgi:hypothetical protein